MDKKEFNKNDPSTYKYNNGDTGFRPVTSENMICRGCPYAEKDVQLGSVVIDGAAKSMCQKFRQKPIEIFSSSKARCQYRNEKN